MPSLVDRISVFVGLDGARRLGDCMVCGTAVRQRDDRMTLHGRFVHTACAGYRIRRVAQSRVIGSRDRDARFTGD